MNKTNCLILVGFLGARTVFASGQELCVNPNDGACFRTIQGAVNAADAGDIILVFPNRDPRGYRENVVINTPDLTLKGVYPDGGPVIHKTITFEKMETMTVEETCPAQIVDTCETVLNPTSCGGDGITIAASGVKLTNFTIRHAKAPPANGNAITLSNANDTFVHNICAIENQGGIRGTGNGVEITASKFLSIQIDEAIGITGNNVVVHNNKLINTDGIEVIGQNARILENFIVQTTDNPCIDVTGTNALIKANKALACASEGISLSAGSDGKILDNFIKAVPDDDEGIFATGNQMEIKQNTIRNTSDSGIALVGDNNSIQHNDIKISGADDDEPGIEITGSNNVISDNISDTSANAGIQNTSGNQNRYENNLSIGNGKSGIRIVAGNQTVLRFNRILKNQGEGINNGAAATNTIIENNTSLNNRTDICNNGTIAVFEDNKFETGGVNTRCVVEQP